MKELKVKSYAKINLFLDIVFKRDDEYHEIKTIYQNISIFDELLFEKGKGSLELFCESSFPIPDDERNLIIRAAREIEKHCGERIKGLKINLKKKIPVGGGLGGGSSNAAATLNAVNNLFDFRYSTEELETLSARIGMDVPFFIKGGTAIGTGRGEIIKRIENQLNPWVIVAYPGTGISTSTAYSLFNKKKCRDDMSLKMQKLIDSLKNGDYLGFTKSVYNSFENLLKEKYPWIEEMKQVLREVGCDGSFLSGSGSTMIGTINSSDKIPKIESKLKKQGKINFWEVAEFKKVSWEIV